MLKIAIGKNNIKMEPSQMSELAELTDGYICLDVGIQVQTLRIL